MLDRARPRRYDDFDITLQFPPSALPPVRPLPAIPFPDPQVLERERQDRAARQAVRDRIEAERQLAASKTLANARRESHAQGFEDGQRRGYNHGWWWGLMFGLLLGSMLCYFAMKAGFAVAWE